MVTTTSHRIVLTEDSQDDEGAVESIGTQIEVLPESEEDRIGHVHTFRTGYVRSGRPT